MSERKIYYVDVGKMSVKEATKLLEQIKRHIADQTHKPMNQYTELVATAASFGAFNISL